MINFKHGLIFLSFVLAFFSGCNTTPVTVSPPVEPSVGKTDSKSQSNPDTLQFDESMISSTQKEEEKNEIDALVKDLNGITRSKQYERWLPFLAKEYVEYYSSADVLSNVSARLPVKNIKLQSLRDYFMYVFVVSRQNCRVDDISYLTPTRVKVIQREKSKSIIIYNLEKFNGKWKIILDN